MDMSRFGQSEYNTTFTTNYPMVLKKLDGKTIVHSVQFIFDEETQIDGNGLNSTWYQFILCLEKTEDDYVFHLFMSPNMLQDYSYPYFKLIPDYNLSSVSLSDFKNKIDSYLGNIDAFTTREISNFICSYDRHTGHANLADENFRNQMKQLNINMFALKRLNNKRIDKERKAFACTYEKYLQSDEYKKIQEERMEAREIVAEIEHKKENNRLQHLINLYGEKQGRLYHTIL